MSPRWAFVKRVNTRYCAFLLGQSQDVGVFVPERVSGKTQIGELFRASPKAKKEKLNEKKRKADL
jgi:hypothetical protein